MLHIARILTILLVALLGVIAQQQFDEQYPYLDLIPREDCEASGRSRSLILVMPGFVTPVRHLNLVMFTTRIAQCVESRRTTI
ncbi:hypothetical protein Q1695_002648 [Nippostrongylus brasiliensis]|nr:hypothetical protein Q1695_002648 [Nippostrongylus brasiliensis]